MTQQTSPEQKSFACTTSDRTNGVTVFCSGPAEMVAGELALPLGYASFAPARSVSVTGETLGIALRLFPTRKEGVNLFLAKGLDQYHLFQPDVEHVCFQIHTDTLHTLQATIPADWYDAWHDLAATYDGATMTLAVDGAVVASLPASGTLRYAPGTLFVGFDPFSGETGSGAVASLQLYNQFSGDEPALHGTPAPPCAADVRFAETSPWYGPTADDAPEITFAGPAPGEYAAPDTTEIPPIEIAEQDNIGRFTGEGFYIEIDLPTATIITWRLDDEELLELGPVHQLWRPPSFPEMLPLDGAEPVAAIWSQAGYAENLMGTTSMEAFQDTPQFVRLDFQGLIIRRNSDVLFSVARTYTIYGNGEVRLEQTLTPQTTLPPLGRMGLEIRLPKAYRHVTVGAAPATRNTGAIETRWLAVQSATGHGLLVSGEAPFVASVSPFSAFQRSEALYPATLTPDSAFTLHLDQALAVAPPAGPVQPLESYGVPVQPWSLDLRLRGLRRLPQAGAGA